MTNTELINETIQETKRFLNYLYVEKRRALPNTEIHEIKRNSEYETAKANESEVPEAYYHCQFMEKGLQIKKMGDVYTIEILGFRPQYKIERCKYDKTNNPMIKARYGNFESIIKAKNEYLKLMQSLINSEKPQGVFEI